MFVKVALITKHVVYLWWLVKNVTCSLGNGPLARYVKLRVVHAPGMPGTFSPPPRVSDPDIHHGTCVTHVSWCIPESLTSGFLWSRWRGKRSLHSRRMRKPQFNISGKRPMGVCHWNVCFSCLMIWWSGVPTVVWASVVMENFLLLILF